MRLAEFFEFVSREEGPDIERVMQLVREHYRVEVLALDELDDR